MCSILWTLLVLPCIALAEITIHIHVGDNTNEASVHAEGEISGMIPEEERAAWRLLDDDLKYTVLNYYSSRRPTQWDEFKYQYMSNVLRTIKANATVQKITNEQDKYTKEEVKFCRNSIHFKPKISHQIEQTISSSWTIGGNLKPSSIRFNVESLVGHSAQEDRFGFTSEWGEDRVHKKTNTVRIKAGTEVYIPAGHKAIATLSITQGTMEVTVQYNAKLSGYVLVNYHKKRTGYYFNSFPVDALLSNVKWPTVITATEVIRIGFIAKTKITITDQKTSKVLYEGAADIV